MGFEAEIWGWNKWKQVKRVQEKYIRWMLGLDGRTPGYTVRGEGKWEKLRTRMGRKAMAYVEKLEKGGGSGWAKKGWEEIEKRGEGKGSR